MAKLILPNFDLIKKKMGSKVQFDLFMVSFLFTIKRKANEK